MGYSTTSLSFLGNDCQISKNNNAVTKKFESIVKATRYSWSKFRIFAQNCFREKLKKSDRHVQLLESVYQKKSTPEISMHKTANTHITPG